MARTIRTIAWLSNIFFFAMGVNVGHFAGGWGDVAVGAAIAVTGYTLCLSAAQFMIKFLTRWLENSTRTR